MTNHARIRGFLSVRLGLITAAAALLWGLCGCERLKETFDRLNLMARPRAERKARVTDRDRVLNKFGEPRERLGIGKAARRENGISYNRKWNYYYASPAGKKPAMRTVYFMDDRFVGSVLHQPDGTVRKEEVRFPY
jgi:hypothetical protein